MTDLTTEPKTLKSLRRRFDRNRKTLRPVIFKRDGYTCVDCGSRSNLSIDHVIPLRDGGDPVAHDNLITRCKKCNCAKN